MKPYLLLRYFVIIAVAGLLSACAMQSPYTSGFGKPSQIKQYQNADSLWAVLGDNFNLPDETADNPSVARELRWYLKHPGYLTAVAKKAEPYLFYIYQQVRKRSLPAELTLMPMIESAYNPFAINMGSGAAGLWQMMTGTALGFGLHVNWWYDGRRDVVASTNAALDYMAYLGNFFNNHWLLAIAAYDTGEGNVQQATEANAKEGKSTAFWDLSLPKETQNYVPKLLALALIIKHPSRYPMIKLPPISNAPYLSEVNIGSQIDLAHAAKMAGISLQELSELNPGYNRWATSPTGPFRILLPIKNAARFEAKLKELPNADRVTWHRVKVKSGDSLISIAKEYHTAPRMIQSINKLKGNLIRVGQVLLIPNNQSKLTDIVINHEKHYFKALHNIPEPNVIHYQVKKGETLWSLASHFKVSTRDLRFWNGLKSNEISPGSMLVIWPPKPKPEYLYYTSWPYRVRQGDSLTSISLRYHVAIDILKQQNHLKSDTLHVNQLLRIPSAHYSTQKHRPATRRYMAKRKPATHYTIKHLTNKPTHTRSTSRDTSYTVKKGDDLYHISRRFGVTETALKQANGITSNLIHIGQKLNVPTKTKPAHATRAPKKHAQPKHTQTTKVLHYIVKKGDTIYGIAKAHHISSNQLMVLNLISSPNDLKIGQRLVLN